MNALGIDVGGTYTDGVLIELPSRKVIRTAKVPTDKDDLAGSVLRCFSALSVHAPALLPRFCISTTLATNAMVEGTKQDVCAVCIGTVPKRSVEYASETVVIDGGHDATGTEVHPLDVQKLKAAIALSERRSFAISAKFGARNPEHELLASRIILEQHPGATVVRGSDLVGVLGMEERLFLAAKNAELMHVMKGLIRAVGSVTRVPDTSIYVLKGDGSLVSTEEARTKPIMTVLSGPAASAVGGGALAGTKNAVVIDIGGTTTDIALLEDGRVRLSEEGAVVGGARLRIPSVDITTVALGGDTEIFCNDERPRLGSRTVRPICLAPDAPRLMRDRSFLFPVKGKVHGITPTDLFCAVGRSEFGDRHVATAALGVLADTCGMPLRELYRALEEEIRVRLLRALSAALIGRPMSENDETDALLRGSGIFRPVLKLDVPIVGIGAPVRPFLDLLAGRVDCKVIVPERHEVGNAVGAVSTGVYARREAVVRCEPRFVQGEEKLAYHVTTGDGQRVFAERDDAVAFAIELAKGELNEYMERSRVRAFETKVEVRDVTYLEWGVRKVAETVVCVTAEESLLPSSNRPS